MARRAKLRGRGRIVKAGLAAIALGTVPVGPAGADPAYGEYLSAECITCHRSEAETGGIPPIAGLPTRYFMGALKDYRAGRRANPVMQSVARSLDDDQIEALAAYYASLKPGEANQ